MTICENCGAEIPPERAEALPNTKTCVACSQCSRRVGYMVATASKGCAPVLMLIPDDPEALRQARNAHLRKR